MIDINDVVEILGGVPLGNSNPIGRQPNTRLVKSDLSRKRRIPKFWVKGHFALVFLIV